MSDDPFLDALGGGKPTAAPVAVRNNNPGNLRYDGKSQWQGMTGVDPNGFVQFDTPENGQRALSINLANQSRLHGLNTVQDIVSKYAPSSDHNDTAAYVARVSQSLGVNPTDTIDPTDPRVNQALQAVIVPTEQGGGVPTPAPQAAANDAPDPFLAALDQAAKPLPMLNDVDFNNHVKDMINNGATADDVRNFAVQQKRDPSLFKNLDDAVAAGRADTVNTNQQTSQGLGFYQGLMHPVDNIATWADEGMKGLGIDTDAINRQLGLPTTNEANAGHAAYIKAQEAQGIQPGRIGDFAGGAIPALAVTALIKNPWAAGALIGAANTDNPHDAWRTATAAALGAAGGKVGDMVVGSIARTIAPKVAATVRQLADQGVSLTPGELMGGTVKRFEDAATSIPIVGDVIKNAQRRSYMSFNRSGVQQTLDPIGVKLPDDVKTGYDAVDFAHRQLSDAYEKAVSPLTMTADDTFKTAMQQIEQHGAYLPPDRAQQFGHIVQDSVLSQFSPDGTMSGSVFKQVDAKLGQLARQYGSSPDPEQRLMADGFHSVQEELRGQMSRSNPSAAPELDKINSGYAKLVRVEGAASSSAATGGVYSPQQFAASVRRYDSSARKNASARGAALMQDFAQAGREVLPSSVPDSGTPLRSAILGTGGVLAAGKAGALGAGLIKGLPLTVPMAAGLSLYTKTGSKALLAAILRRPDGAEQLANALTKLKTPAVVAGSTAAPQLAQGR